MTAADPTEYVMSCQPVIGNVGVPGQQPEHPRSGGAEVPA